MAKPVKQTEEREIKLAVPPGFRLPELPGEPLEATRFTSTYVDTEDRRLARARVTLRRRVERGKSVWQLKLPHEGDRLELEESGGPAGPPGGLAEMIAGLVRGKELAPVAVLRTKRSGVRVRENGSAIADVVLDEVARMDGRRIAERFTEVEIEAVNGGDRPALERIAEVLRASGALPSDGRPKVFRSLRIPPRPVPAFTEEAEHVRAAIEAQYDQMVAHDPGTRVGRDPEALHRFRVATRRLRAILRAAGPLLDPGWASELREELKWLGGVLGPVRDLDVLLEHLEHARAELLGDERAASAELVAKLVAERADARAAMLEALASERYVALLDRLEAAAREPRILAGTTTLADLAAREFGRLEKAGAGVKADSSDDALHELRIRAKRARYAAELAEASVGKRATRFVERAKLFQDVVGEHQDAVVAEERIRGLCGTVKDARVAFAAGRLVERQQARRRLSREAFPPAWQKLQRSGRRAWA